MVLVLHKGEKAGRWGGRIWDCLPRRQGIYLVILLLASNVVALAIMQNDLNEFARIKREMRKDEITEE